MQKEKIILINSQRAQTKSLDQFWVLLAKKHFLIESIDSKNEHRLAPDAKNFFFRSLCYLVLPLRIFKAFLATQRSHALIIVTNNSSDCFAYSLLSKLQKFRHLHLLLPEDEVDFIACKGIKQFCRKTDLIIFNSRAKNFLDQHTFKNKKFLLLPGIEPKNHQRQETIFNSLAKADRPQRKFFTLGTIVDLNTDSHLESLLKAVKEIAQLIPNLQLIIVGDGPEKKNLQWMAKQLGVESIAWFVGSTDQPSKWLENLDLYIVTKPHLPLRDQTFILEIMQRGLPVIADLCSGLDDIIFEDKTGKLVNFSNANDIAEAVISLEQDKKQLDKMRENSRERVEKLFSIDKQLDQFAKLL
jgi:glycosyltransferase involved in cell wall biosynthesis